MPICKKLNKNCLLHQLVQLWFLFNLNLKLERTPINIIPATPQVLSNMQLCQVLDVATHQWRMSPVRITLLGTSEKRRARTARRIPAAERMARKARPVILMPCTRPVQSPRKSPSRPSNCLGNSGSVANDGIVRCGCNIAIMKICLLCRLLASCC